MKPLKSVMLPCLTPLTVSCSTVPRPGADSKITVPVSPKDSSVPWSVSSVPSGTLTVDEADGDDDADPEADPEADASALSGSSPEPELQPASATAVTVVRTARDRAGRSGEGTRTFCTPTRRDRGRTTSQQPSSRSAK